MGKGSGSAKADVTEYRMSIHMGVALELDSVRKVIIDEKTAWWGNLSANAAVNINQPSLFGGEKKEGGLVGTMQVLMGRADQILPAAVAARYGKAPNDCPAFRGLTTLMFHGSGQVSSGNFNVWQYLAGGGAFNTTGNGFLWKHNSAVIAQKVEVEGTCAPKTILNQAYAMIANPDHPDKPDANPAHMIYEALVDEEFGMGGSPDLIDTATFEAVAQTLFNEGFGLTILWMRQTTIEQIINEILDHIQATLFADPTTGKLAIKLLRDDYGDPETLFVVSPDNAKLSNYKVRSGGEIVNEITVNWTNPVNEQSESITAHDNASIQSQGGEKVANSRDYYAVRHAALARKLLARDLRASTAPLVSCEAVVDRSLWDKKPGDVVRLDWPRRSLYGLVMRVGKVNYGKPTSTSIRVSLVQDVFSLSRPPITIDPGTGWEDPAAEPQPLTMQISTLPSFFTRNGQLQRTPVIVGESEVLAMSLGDSQDNDSLDYELVAPTPGPDGTPVVQSHGAMTMTPLAYLGDTLPAAAQSELPADLFPDINHAPVTGSFVWIGYGDANQEICLVSGVTATGWTIERGCLDTVPKAWGINTPVWVVNPGAIVVDTQVVRAEGEEVTYRGLDRTSLGLLAYEDAPDAVATMTARPHLPLRPANVQINGDGFGSWDVTGSAEFTITWATRNRLLEDTQAMLWTDGPVSPEYRQETVVAAYDEATGNLIVEYPNLWTENSITFQKTDFDRYANVRFEVFSRRDDDESLQRHKIVATGFAANAGAAPPPDAPPREEPPSTVSPPAVNAFSATAGVEQGADGSRSPTIDYSGLQDNPDAAFVVARYRAQGATPWQYSESVPLRQEQVNFKVRGVQSGTTYETGVAYVVNGIVSGFRALDNVTASTSIASDTVNVAGRSAYEILVQVDDLIATYGDTASAAASAAAAALDADAADAARAAALLYRDDAEDQAGLASGYATTSQSNRDAASGYADASQASAVAAVAARDAVITVSRNGDFSAGKLGWEEYGLTTYHPDAAGWAHVLETGIGVNSTITGAPIVVGPGDVRYRANLQFLLHSASADVQFYAGFLFYDNTGALIAGSDGTGNYPLIAATVFTPGTQVTREAIIGRGGVVPNSPYGGTTVIPAGAFSFRPILYYNYNSVADARIFINYFLVTDVTSEQSAGNYASAAQSSAATATAQAAAAQSSATLAASVASSSILANSRFSDWTALTGSGFPAPWGTADTYLSGGSTVSQVAGEISGTSGLRFNIGAGAAGTVQAYGAQITDPGTITPGGWYVIEADVRLDAGSMLGSGVYFVLTSADGSGLSSHLIEFYSDPDNNTGSFIASGVVGRVYRFAKLVQSTSASTVSRTRTYALGRFTGFAQGVSEAAAQITFLKLVVRPASAQEIELRQARGGATSLGAKITDVANVAASATSAVATRTSIIEAGANSPNKLFNPSGQDGMSGWESLGAVPFIAGRDLTWGAWFNTRFDGQSAISATLRSQPFQAGYGVTWTLSSQAFSSGLISGYCYLGVYGYTNAEGTTGETALCNYNIQPLGSPGAFKVPDQTFVAPVGIVSFRVWVQLVGSGASYAHVGFWKMKVEAQGYATPFTDETTQGQGYARVTIAEGAISTLNGRNAAWAQTEVNAGSSATAFVRLYAETSPGVITSDVSIGAREIHLFNQIGNSFLRALSVVGGNAIFYGGLTAATFIRQGSGEGWPVALAQRDFVGGDGATFTWGLTFDNFPSYIAAMNNLAPLAAGETYDVRLNVTKTGATVIAKIITPGSPTNYGPITPDYASGTSAPDYTVGVTNVSRGESNDGTYNLAIYTYWDSSFYQAGGSQEYPYEIGWDDSGNVYVDVFALKAGVWTLVSTEIFSHYVQFQGGFADHGWNSYGGSGYTETRSIQMGTGVQAIGVQYSTYDGGSGPYAGGSGSLSSAGWQAAGSSSTTRSATPGGQTTRFTVIPK